MLKHKWSERRSMALRVLLIVFLSCMLFTTAKGSVYISGCSSGHRKLIDGYDSVSMYCYQRTNSYYEQFQWTLTTNNGFQFSLATCYGKDNCKVFLEIPGAYIRARMSSRSSNIYLSQLPEELFGNITCTAISGTQESSDSCRLLVERIRMYSPSSDLYEKESTNFSCYTSSASPSAVTWTLTSQNRQTLLLGSCYDVGSCTSPLSPDVTVSRDLTVSRVHFMSPTTNMTGQLSCFFSYNGLMYFEEISLKFHEPPWLSGCDGGSLDLLEGNRYFNIFYHETRQPGSIIYWTLELDNGTSVPAATCYAPYNCTTLINNLLYYTHRGYDGRCGAFFYHVPVDFSGSVKCTEVGTTTISRSCRLNLVYIRMVPGYNVIESSSIFIYCYISPTVQSNVTWILTTLAGQVLNLGSCTSTGNRVCTSLMPDVTLKRSSSDSGASLRRVQRDKSGYVTCSVTHNHRLEKAQTQLNVYQPATVDNCSVIITAHNWSAVVTCDVTHMFSNDGVYEYRVEGNVQLRETSGIPQHVSWPEKRSFGDSLSAYINNSDNKQYFKGRLVASWRLSSIPANYLSVTVIVNASVGSTSFQIGHNPFNVSQPAIPNHNCSNTQCTCITTDIGSPAGRLLWLLGDSILATGDYGQGHLAFPAHLVGRDITGTTAVCLLDWIQPVNTSFLLYFTAGDNHTATDKHQPKADDNKATWMVAGGGVVLAVVAVVVLVVVGVVVYRRGYYQKCPCMQQIYDKPRSTRSNERTEEHVYDQVATGRPIGPLPENRHAHHYENAAFEEQRHM